MSQWAFMLDDAGDLVNLYKMECIWVAEIVREEGGVPVQDAPEGHTHEVLAVNGSQESYRLRSGTQDQCKAFMQRLANALVVDI